MDGHDFDNLTRRLAAGVSRRGLAKGVLGGIIGGFASLRVAQTEAARGPLGAPCTRASECASFRCVDGVCCDSPCLGQCETCATGTCLPATGAPVGNRPACPGSGDCAGVCDGITRNACVFPGAETACGAATCAGGVQSAFACAGNGACHATTTSCGLFRCNAEGTGCLTNCQDNDDCIGAAFCANGVCQGDQPLGQACITPDQCQSGLCIDGVCCVESCEDPCRACNVPGALGFCAPVADGAICDDGNPCTRDDACRNGHCHGTPVDCTTPGVCEAAPGTCNPQTGECLYPDALDNSGCGTNQFCCAGACCPAGEACVNGACQSGPASACQSAPDNSGCGTNQVCCGGNCCAAGETCVNGSCQPGACIAGVGLDSPCDPTNNLCCQDEPTFCESWSVLNITIEPRCCHHRGDSCTERSDCCDLDFCHNGTCCLFSGQCDADDQCCTGICCNGECCSSAKEVCVDGTCEFCSEAGFACDPNHNDCCSGLCVGGFCQQGACVVSGGFCTSQSDCCEPDSCHGSRCCRSSDPCDSDDQCCSGGCCNGVCCLFGKDVCVNGACVTCANSGLSCDPNNNDCCSGLCCDGVCCSSSQICVNGTCEACRQAGEHCLSAGDDCCHDLVCARVIGTDTSVCAEPPVIGGV